MRNTLTAASGRPNSLPFTGPAQAAAGDLPGRGQRKAGRGKTSSVSHGAVWENPGEAAQRTGKGYGGSKGAGGFAWGVLELVKRLDTCPVTLGRHFRGLPLDRGAGGRVSKETAVAKEIPVPHPPRVAEGWNKSSSALAPGV